MKKLQKGQVEWYNIMSELQQNSFKDKVSKDSRPKEKGNKMCEKPTLKNWIN